MDNAKFCENMNYYRTKSDLTFAELSAKLKLKNLDVTPATLQRYECGKIKNVPYDTLVLLAEVLDITPIELMGWGEDMKFRRSLDIESRFTDMIAELDLRNDTFNFGGKELSPMQVTLIKGLLTNALENARLIANVK